MTGHACELRRGTSPRRPPRSERSNCNNCWPSLIPAPLGAARHNRRASLVPASLMNWGIFPGTACLCPTQNIQLKVPEWTELWNSSIPHIYEFCQKKAQMFTSGEDCAGTVPHIRTTPAPAAIRFRFCEESVLSSAVLYIEDCPGSPTNTVVTGSQGAEADFAGRIDDCLRVRSSRAVSSDALCDGIAAA